MQGPSEGDWRQSEDPEEFDLWRVPGHLMRRVQQRAVEIFLREVGDSGPTPRQFAVLITVFQDAGLNQTALVRATGMDRSTVGEMVGRLVKRGWLRRNRTHNDGRANALHVTEEGERVLREFLPAVNRAQERILGPLREEERSHFLDCLDRLSDLPRPDNSGRNP